MKSQIARLAAGWHGALIAGRDRRRAAAVALALGGLIGFALWRQSRQVALRTPATWRRVAAPAPRSPSEAALREASRSLNRAQLAVNAKLQTLRDWDPQAFANTPDESLRRQSMQSEHPNELRQARAAARRAMALARTPRERLAAVALLAWIEHNAGRHKEELRLARELVRMAPHSRVSLDVFQRASRCVAGVPPARRTAPMTEMPRP